MKTIVITGSTRGIGLGMAKFFLNKGHQVVINGTTDQSVEKALNSLMKGSDGKRILGVAGRINEVDNCERIAVAAEEAFGSIDIWINNAGIPQLEAYFYDYDPDALAKLININVLGVVYGSQVAYNHMSKTGGGYIYNMEGLGSDGRKMSRQTFYGASKRAVRYLTRSMALETKGGSVKIGTLSPGMVATDFLKGSLHGTAEEIAQKKKIFNILADHVEDVVEFLGSEILKNTKHNAKIEWLTTPKIMKRFLMAPFIKRKIFE